MKRDRIRIGDQVRIVTPKVVVRVGYPKAVADYLPVVRERHGAHLDAIFRSDIEPPLQLLSPELPWPRSKVRRRVEMDLAYMLAHEDGFGGRRRELHLEERPELAGQEARVDGLRTVMTGVYAPGYSNGGWYNDDYEPAALDDRKPHRLAHLLVFPEPIEIPIYFLKRIPTDEKQCATGDGADAASGSDYCEVCLRAP
jgi:hypothetical protein